MAGSLFLTFLTVFTWIGRCSAQLPESWKPADVVTFFCSRWFHQSVVKNRTLHVYGGIQTFQVPNVTVKTTNNTLGYNPFLLQLDLTKSWDWQQNISWRALDVTNNPRTGSHVRNGMIKGAMYAGPANQSVLWTYGGTSAIANESFLNAAVPYANQYPLWSFDEKTNDWNQFDLGQFKTPSNGLSAEAIDQGLAFYLSGQTDNGTDPDTRHDGNITTPLAGMIVIDLVRQSARNISVNGMQNSQPRVGGSMQYAPGLGDDGVLVALGGRVYDGMRVPTSQDKGRLLTFDAVDIFDIAAYRHDTANNGSWYNQATSGDIPKARIDSCTIIASAPDNSSHNIYLYGGWDPTGDQQKWFDDIYALSLPSFTWIKMYEAESPRYGHTCHLVGRQMMTIGGHNVRRNITNMCDWETESVAILDLPTMTWGSVFNSTVGEYEVSRAIVDKIGGTSRGGTALKEPTQGWSSPKLKTIMSSTRIYSDTSGTLEVIRPTPIRKGMKSSTRTAIIAGVTTAGSILILGVLTLLLFCRAQRKRRDVAELSEGGNRLDSATEVEDKSKFELSPEEKKIYELNGEWRHEAPDTLVRAEADRANVVVQAVELPTTSFTEHGRWGIPLIKEPTPNTSRRGSEVSGKLPCSTHLQKMDHDRIEQSQ